MKSIASMTAICACVVLYSSATFAQGYDPYGRRNSGDGYGSSSGSYGYGSQKPGSGYGYDRREPRPAASPYDRPTLGDPQPRIYGKTPTLGDPRPYRRTSPKTCTGLLCD